MLVVCKQRVPGLAFDVRDVMLVVCEHGVPGVDLNVHEMMLAACNQCAWCASVT